MLPFGAAEEQAVLAFDLTVLFPVSNDDPADQ